MLFRICRSIDKISEILSDPLNLSSLILARDKKLIQSGRLLAKDVPNVIARLASSMPESSMLHCRLDIGNDTLRVFLLKDTVVAAVREDSVGNIVSYGTEVYEYLAKVFESSDSIRLLAEEMPFQSLRQDIVDIVNSCIEEAEKPYVVSWKKKGLYSFNIEKLVSDKGVYTYVFKARDQNGEVYALKVLKEEVVVDRDFSDLTRGYVQGLAVSKITDDELLDLIELKGYERETLKELLSYRTYVSSIRALLVLKDRLDKKLYTLYPPAIVEDFASLGDLETYVLKNGYRSLEEASYLAIRITGATALAHLMGIPHLDIKPRNILLFEEPKEPYGYVPKLSDFSGAIGDPAHGFKLTRLTPGYTDPAILAKGISDFSYDVYSIAMTTAYMLSGNIPKHRLVLNIILLQSLYGYPIPMEKIEEDEDPLREFAKKTFDMVVLLKSKAITWREFVDKIGEDIEALDSIYMPWLSEVPKPIAIVIKRSLALRSDQRYKNCVDMWLDFRDALVKENMEKLLPK